MRLIYTAIALTATTALTLTPLTLASSLMPISGVDPFSAEVLQIVRAAKDAGQKLPPPQNLANFKCRTVVDPGHSDIHDMQCRFLHEPNLEQFRAIVTALDGAKETVTAAAITVKGVAHSREASSGVLKEDGPASGKRARYMANLIVSAVGRGGYYRSVQFRCRFT